ncbi:MAG TPA: hypothetical protein VLC09_10125 [Polyangiaceae bacterium]|nr:hypothetical protein [Polyangiaceae bacterium]
MQRVSRPATLVVIEFSAAWPQWLKPTSTGDMAVVAQHYEGHPSTLVTQVATRTTRLEAVGWNLQSIVLVSNGRTDPDSLAARSILARGLLSRLRLRGRGELLLTIDERLGKRASSHLRALGTSLEHSLRGAHLSLGVRIGEEVWYATEPSADSVVAPLARMA